MASALKSCRFWSIAFGFAAALALFFAIAWAVRLYPAEPRWGPLSSWFSALGTLAAVAVAVRSSHHQAEMTKHARRERDQAEADRDKAELRLLQNDQERLLEARQRQASGVAWWVEHKPSAGNERPQGDFKRYITSDGIRLPSDGDAAYFEYVALHIINENKSPLYACVVSNEDTGEKHFIGILPPGESVYLEPTLGMGEGTSTFGRTLARIAEGHPIEFVEFVDTEGVVWRRLLGGRLIEATKAPEVADTYVW